MEGQPRRALQDKMGGQGPCRGGFVTLLLAKRSDHPWNMFLCLRAEKNGSLFKYQHYMKTCHHTSENATICV